MKILKYFSLFALFLALGFHTAFAATTDATADSLESQLESLSLPENQAPAGVSQEKIYAVQTRYAPLRFKSEVSLGGVYHLNSVGYMSSQEVNLGYRLHFSDRWSLGASGSYCFNSFTSSGLRLIAEEKRVPDLAFPKNRYDLTLGYNLFYGKFRLSMDQVLYFDQYWSVGPGLVDLNTSGLTPAGVIDAGLVFWIGKSGSLKLGVKDYIYKERRILGESIVNNLLGHLDVGFLFGGSAQ